MSSRWGACLSLDPPEVSGARNCQTRILEGLLYSLSLHSLLIYHDIPQDSHQLFTCKPGYSGCHVCDLCYTTDFPQDESHPPRGGGGTIGTFLFKLVTGGSLAWIAGNSSVITLVVIAAERYYAVIYPIGNVGKFTRGKLKVSHLQKSVNTSSIYQACADSYF